MESSFPRYLLAKQSVDDRALNKEVLTALKASLPPGPLSIIEVGGGIGTMLARMLRWDLLTHAEYTLVDEMAENIVFARDWLPGWASEHGFQISLGDGEALRIFDDRHEVQVYLVQSDVFEFIQREPAPADLLIAHAVLDLLPMPDSLPELFSLTKELAWLTINFDGVTSLEPVIEAALDARIESLYHHSMDTRPSGGDSQAGRHLFLHLKQVGAEILSAGASDWVVYPVHGRYPSDEAYFLDFILNFFEESLTNHPELEAGIFSDWLRQRRLQVDQAELIYIAHQMDFLVKK
jgi:hypothetical protein